MGVSPLADVWGAEYSSHCGIPVEVNTGGSSEGARLACGIGSDLTADPDIGMMSRGFKAEEATTAADGFTYTCVFGDVGSTGVSVDVANDGVTVFAQTGGTAGNCLEKLAPAGVTHDELVKEHPAAVTFIGYPDYAIETDKTAVPVEGVLPTLESISAGEYSLLGRQIFMRVRASSGEEGVPFVLDGLLGPTPDGFVPLSDDQIYEQIGKLLTLVL